MKIKAFYNGLLSSNSYVVYDEISYECMIVDLGVKPDYVVDFIKNNGLSVKYLVLTHGHYDHAHFVGKYMELYSAAKAICHTDEIKVLTDSFANVSDLVGDSSVYDYDYTVVNDGDLLTLGNTEFKVLSFPGHTPGCICLLCEKDKIMFTGDVIFAQGYGRTDFKYGSPTLMMQSLRKITTMDEDITIYPGHGESSTLKKIFE